MKPLRSLIPYSPVSPSSSYEQGDPQLRAMLFCRKLEQWECESTAGCQAIYGDGEFNMYQGVYEQIFMECTISKLLRDYFKTTHQHQH